AYLSCRTIEPLIDPSPGYRIAVTVHAPISQHITQAASIAGSRRSESWRWRSAGCINAGGRAPLPGIRVNGAWLRSRWQRGGRMRAMSHRAGESELQVAAEAADPGYAGKFGGGK